MPYVTQGKIHVEFEPGTQSKIKVRISPAQEYAITHQSKSFIVFIKDDSSLNNREAVVFEKSQIFSAKVVSANTAALLNSALQQTRVEVKIGDSKLPAIESFVIPAIVGS